MSTQANTLGLMQQNLVLLPSVIAVTASVVGSSSDAAYTPRR